MGKIRRFLLMAAQGGSRYLRAILRAVMGLNAKATTAPGSDMEAELEAGNPNMTAEGVNRPAADGSIQGEPSVKLLAVMVAKLISDAVFRGQALLGNLTTNISADPAADMEGVFRVGNPPMTADAESAPGIPMDFPGRITAPKLSAEPQDAPPAHTETELTPKTQLAATPDSGSPGTIAANMENPNPALAADILPGTPGDGVGEFEIAAQLSAKMHTWREPIQSGTNLYMPQVYGFEPDGTNLKIL